MSEGSDGNIPPGIAALPPTTVRQIGSHQLLTDPSSVVKELIDNALDARAKSIFVDITTNTIDSVQVKDDGHGIPNEDRALACRRYCTSKIRDFHDLKEVGGRWLGFRGEALASIADMSGTVSITTRVEGEPVAVKLTYQRNGELFSTERDSHPVGTTIKVTKLLEPAKVRKELAVKGSVKCLAKIRRLMQAYALARPAVRFRLHVLKAKNDKGDFVYAPKANANVEDAALKIVGKECALQCDWTALEMDDFELQAFLPKPTASGNKVANYGAFISVDSRPVSPTRGTLKRIATAIRDRIRKANLSLTGVKDPFFCLNIICPTGSYDPNIEPAKDDVIFSDEAFIIKLVDRLLISYYPENIAPPDFVEGIEDVMLMEPSRLSSLDEPSSRPRTPLPIHQDAPTEEAEVPSSAMPSQRPRWRSSMYGIDEENLEFLQEDTLPVFEDEEGRRHVAVSNPWTIARMNAPVKPKQPVSKGQLLSPAKSQGDTSKEPKSPTPAATPQPPRSVEPLTPQSSSRTNIHSNALDAELQRGIQYLPQPASQDGSGIDRISASTIGHAQGLLSFEGRISPNSNQPRPQPHLPDVRSKAAPVPRRNERSQRTFRNNPFVTPVPQTDDIWFGQPMRGAPKTTRPQKQPRQRDNGFFPHDDTFSSQRSLILPATERLGETERASKNDTDIRNFFGRPGRVRPNITPTCPPQESLSIAEQLRSYAENESSTQSPPCRPGSVESYRAQEMDAFFQFHQGTSPSPLSSPIRRNVPSDVVPASRPRRLRTADSGLRRTKSATLPLNFIPHGFETHNLILPKITNISSIVQQSRKLDMAANSLGWGYDTLDAFDVFITPISERRIMDWVIKVDCILRTILERLDGVEVCGALHEGVQRFLDTRKQEEDSRMRMSPGVVQDLGTCLSQSDVSVAGEEKTRLPNLHLQCKEETE